MILINLYLTYFLKMVLHIVHKYYEKLSPSPYAILNLSEIIVTDI